MTCDSNDNVLSDELYWIDVAYFAIKFVQSFPGITPLEEIKHINLVSCLRKIHAQGRIEISYFIDEVALIPGRVISLRIDSNKSRNTRSIKFSNVVLTLLFIIICGLSDSLAVRIVAAMAWKVNNRIYCCSK